MIHRVASAFTFFVNQWRRDSDTDRLRASRKELIAALVRARRCIAWACKQRPEFQAEYDAVDAAIAKAREAE